MSVTVSIVVHKTPLPQLERAVECLLVSPEVKSIYVMDNSPTNALKSIASKDGRIFYRRIVNRGFGAGHNVAIREIVNPDFPNVENYTGNSSESDNYHLVMNADVWWKEDIIKKLSEYMRENPDVGMVMPKVFYPDGTLQYTCRMLPAPFDVFAKRFLPASIIKNRVDRYLLAHHDHDKPLNCPYLLGSFLFFRNEVLKECSGFDERFFMYPEDIDITRRIHRNWKTMYWPGVSIVHEHQAASRRNLRMLWIHVVNMISYFNKWGWLKDKERKDFNNRLLESVSYLPLEKRVAGKG